MRDGSDTITSHPLKGCNITTQSLPMASTDRKDAKGEGKKKKAPRAASTTPKLRSKEGPRKNKVMTRTLRLAMGMTCPNRNCFAVNPFTGTAVYPASGVAVFLDTINCKQAGYIQASTHSISCLAFSPDGQYLLLGELGHMPALRVWSMAHDHQIAEFQGHEYGIAYAAFSGKMDLLVSLGTNHDGTIFVWAWPSQERVSCNRFAEAIYAMSFSGIDPFFVTCGSHHIRFWYPDTKSSRFEPDTLLGRSVIMRDIKTRTYVDVAFGSERSAKFVYSVTTCGLVCKINSERQVTQFHRLHHAELSSVQASGDQLVIASVDGQVHFFNALSMQYRASISVPIDASLSKYSFRGGSSAVRPASKGWMYLGLDNQHKILTAIVDNGDLCIWDIGDLSNIKRKFFSTTHNKQVSGIDACLTKPDRAVRSLDTLFSVAHDGTLRKWKVCLRPQACSETKSALYTGCYCPRDPATCETEVITTVKANPSLGLVVIGDSKGLVTVYEAGSLQALFTIQRHSRSVTIISFYSTSVVHRNAKLMLTGARDRVINVYDVKKDFQVLNSLSLHSGSISALAMLDGTNCMKLLSSALDRTVILSCTSPEEPYHFTPHQCRHTTSSVVDIQVCPETHWTVLGRSNAILTVLDARSFQSVCTFRACADPNGQLEKLHVDSQGTLVVTACSDRSINLMSLPKGLRLACFTGHAAPVSGLLLCASLRLIVSSSRDGCVLVWSIPGKVKHRALHLFKRGTRKGRTTSTVKRSSRASKPVRSSTDLSSRDSETGDEAASYVTACSHRSQSSTMF